MGFPLVISISYDIPQNPILSMKAPILEGSMVEGSGFEVLWDGVRGLWGV